MKTDQPPPFIRLRNVSVDYPLEDMEPRSLRGQLTRLMRQRSAYRRPTRKVALQNVSLNIRAGDRVGLLGANGSGKTTLLRVVQGLYEPREGSVTTRGRIATFINLTAGMDLWQSGLNNIKLRGEFVGLSTQEMNALIPDVAEFTELGEALYHPIKTYSSGMLARLSFAIATGLSADIILMDEWISAGDVRFFERAEKRMRALFDDRTILILATHSDGLARSWCKRLVVLDHGRVDVVAHADLAVARRNELLNAAPPAPTPASKRADTVSKSSALA